MTLEGAVTLQMEDVKGAAWAGGVNRTVPIIEDKRSADQVVVLESLHPIYLSKFQNALLLGAPPCRSHPTALLV